MSTFTAVNSIKVNFKLYVILFFFWTGMKYLNKTNRDVLEFRYCY